MLGASEEQLSAADLENERLAEQADLATSFLRNPRTGCADKALQRYHRGGPESAG
jgi:hypothetical protein